MDEHTKHADASNAQPTAPSKTTTQQPAPREKKKMKRAPMWSFYVLVSLFALGLLYEFTKDEMSMVLVATWIIFGSIVVVNRKQFFSFQKQQSVLKPDTHEALSSATSTGMTEPQAAQSTPKKPIQKWKIVTLIVGAFVILIVGAILFMPNAYLWIALQAGFPSQYATDSTVYVARSLSTTGEQDAADSYEDSITINTVAKYIAPRTWSFVTVLKNDAGTTSEEGVEVLVFDNEAFQRQTGMEEGVYTEYPLEAGEYETTEQAIVASSLFIPELFDYAGAGRFVWDTGEQPWWHVHYRFPINVAQLEADAPDWFEPQLYPFATETQLGLQEITFMLDVWIHPFTGRVMHEVWNITKRTTADDQYDVALDIIMIRDYNFSTDFTIEKPET